MHRDHCRHALRSHSTDTIGRCAKAAIPEQIYKTVARKIMTLAAGLSKLYLDHLTH
jgi:hypothetical protein